MADLARPRGGGSCTANRRVNSSWVLPAPLKLVSFVYDSGVLEGALRGVAKSIWGIAGQWYCIVLTSRQ